VSTFNVISADPPWPFGDKLPGKKRGAAKHYPPMPVEAIKQMVCGPNQRGARFCNVRVLSKREFRQEPTRRFLADDALLFLWRVAAMQEEALAVARAWGFEPKSELTWVKLKKGTEISRIQLETDGDLVTVLPPLHFGMGRYARQCHESCLVATRGKGRELIVDHGVRSTFFAPVQDHSRKPAEFYETVERLVGPGARKLELFARSQRSGWTCTGEESGE